MLTRARDNVGLPTLIVVVLLALAPLVIGSAAGQSVIIVAMIYAVGAVGLDLLTGYSGQFSFGQFVYFATGAYIMASLEINAHLTWWVALIIAVLGSGLLAGLVGAAMVRLRFFGSAVGTFFLGAAVVDIISGSHLARWTGASNGLPVAPVSLGSLALTSGYGLYYTVLTGLVLATALCVRYTKIRAGVAARVVKESEIVAASMGIRVFREKLRAQVTGGLLAGLGGCLLAMNLGYLSPDTFDVSQSIELFAIVAVGGTGSIAGPILGALFFFGVTNSLPSGSSSELVFALIMLAVVVFFNRGIYGIFETLIRLARRRVPALDRQLDQLARRWPFGRRLAVPAGAPAVAGIVAPAVAGAGTAAAAPAAAAPAPPVSASTARESRDVLLEVRDIGVEFGGVKALDGISLDVRRGEVHAIIGPNGAGKTTFLNCISGIQPLSGRITLDGKDLAPMPVSVRRQAGIARTFQHPSLVSDLNVVSNVKIGAYERHTTSVVGELLNLPGTGQRARAARDRAVSALRTLDFPEARWGEQAGDITMGEQKHVDIARAMAGSPRLLLLDEPTAGLGAEEVAAVARAIAAVRDAGVTILVIAHHVGFIRQVADWCTVLNFGSVVASGTPAEVLQDPTVVEIFVGAGAKAATESGETS